MDAAVALPSGRAFIITELSQVRPLMRFLEKITYLTITCDSPHASLSEKGIRPQRHAGSVMSKPLDGVRGRHFPITAHRLRPEAACARGWLPCVEEVAPSAAPALPSDAPAETRFVGFCDDDQ
jgi:hypothetical protein